VRKKVTIAVRHSNLVKRYLRMFKVPRFYPGDKEDLLQVGMIGLLRAIETYDETKSAFETWAWFWIRSSIRDEVKRFKYIHLPLVDTYVPGTSADVKVLFKQMATRLDKKNAELLKRFLAGQNTTEVGKEWGVSRQSVDQRLTKIIQKLKDET